MDNLLQPIKVLYPPWGRIVVFDLGEDKFFYLGSNQLTIDQLIVEANLKLNKNE